MGKGVRRWLIGLGCLVLLGIVAAFILPMLAQPRCHRIPCPNNLKQIGLGLKMYAGNHKGRYPDKLVELSRYVGHQSSLLFCPISGSKPGPIETVDEWTDYVYVSGLSETNAPDTVLMYCPAKNHRGAGGNVLFADGHVEWFNSKHSKDFVEDESSFEDMIGSIGEQR